MLLSVVCFFDVDQKLLDHFDLINMKPEISCNYCILPDIILQLFLEKTIMEKKNLAMRREICYAESAKHNAKLRGSSLQNEINIEKSMYFYHLVKMHFSEFSCSYGVYCILMMKIMFGDSWSDAFFVRGSGCAFFDYRRICT